jgi:hypothetical protein
MYGLVPDRSPDGPPRVIPPRPAPLRPARVDRSAGTAGPAPDDLPRVIPIRPPAAPACDRCGSPAGAAGAVHCGPGAGEVLCGACTRTLTITCSTADLRPIRLDGRRRPFRLETK